MEVRVTSCPWQLCVHYICVHIYVYTYVCCLLVVPQCATIKSRSMAARIIGKSLLIPAHQELQASFCETGRGVPPRRFLVGREVLCFDSGPSRIGRFGTLLSGLRKGLGIWDSLRFRFLAGGSLDVFGILRLIEDAELCES